MGMSMNRSALFLVIFGIIYLLFFSLSYRRSKRWVVPAGEAPDVTLARRKSNRFMIGLTAAIVLGSWAAAAVLSLGGVDLPHVSVEMIFTSILVLCWVIVVVTPTLRLRELSKKLELAGGADAGLLKTIEAVKAARLKFAVLFGIMAGISLINLIDHLIA